MIYGLTVAFDTSDVISDHVFKILVDGETLVTSFHDVPFPVNTAMAEFDDPTNKFASGPAADIPLIIR